MSRLCHKNRNVRTSSHQIDGIFGGSGGGKDKNNFLVSKCIAFAFHLAFTSKCNIFVVVAWLLLRWLRGSRTAHEKTIMPSLINMYYFILIKIKPFFD